MHSYVDEDIVRPKLKIEEVSQRALVTLARYLAVEKMGRPQIAAYKGRRNRHDEPRSTVGSRHSRRKLDFAAACDVRIRIQLSLPREPTVGFAHEIEKCLLLANAFLESTLPRKSGLDRKRALQTGESALISVHRAKCRVCSGFERIQFKRPEQPGFRFLQLAKLAK